MHEAGYIKTKKFQSQEKYVASTLFPFLPLQDPSSSPSIPKYFPTVVIFIFYIPFMRITAVNAHLSCGVNSILSRSFACQLQL